MDHPTSYPPRPRFSEDPMEMKIFGVNACRAFFEHRPEQIVRAYFAEDVAYRFGYVMKACAQARKAYRIIDTFEMDKIAETKSHQGICFLVKKTEPFTIKEYLEASIDLDTDCIVALERLGNPHNVGSILRTCAHFGVEGLLVSDAVIAQSGPAIRGAEGGAEFVQFVDAGRISDALPIFKAAGYTVVGTSSHQGENLYTTELPDKMLLMMGPESSGLSDFLIEDADLMVKIPGSESVESLNVATATGIVLGEYWRQKEFEPGQAIAPPEDDGPIFEGLEEDDDDDDLNDDYED
ncbi:MAG: tRNA/rRNA methyltransferase [Verrucomicrobia bacterium]|nr:tRNA/rRNA methyltransferase [Verrucomicrobiota bacterium]MCH8512758.1 tRNA/rRNA methyltransferase [Kiritimatiellia bacterium]